MKTPITSAVLGALMLVGAVSPALAQNRPIPAVRQEVQEKRGEIKNEVKDRLSNARKDRLQNWWNRSAKRLGSLIERLRKMTDRTENRIDHIATAGGNVEKARADLVQVRAKIDAAQTALRQATAKVPSILTSENAVDAYRDLRALHKDVVAKIRGAHKALVALVQSLKHIPTLVNPSKVTPPPTR